MQHEHREQRALLAAWQVDRAPALTDLEQPKQPDLHDPSNLTPCASQEQGDLPARSRTQPARPRRGRLCPHGPQRAAKREEEEMNVTRSMRAALATVVAIAAF